MRSNVGNVVVGTPSSVRLIVSLSPLGYLSSCGGGGCVGSDGCDAVCDFPTRIGLGFGGIINDDDLAG